MGRAVKNSLEIIIKRVRLEGGFERGGRIRVAECLRQIVPDRWASIRKRSFANCFCVYTGGEVKGSEASTERQLATFLPRLDAGSGPRVQVAVVCVDRKGGIDRGVCWCLVGVNRLPSYRLGCVAYSVGD